MQESQIEEELMEHDVMDTEGSLHQKPRDVCAIKEVMNDDGSLHYKTNEVCITKTLSPLMWGGLRTRS